MLFISRRVFPVCGDGGLVEPSAEIKYGVVDTDDCVETIADMNCIDMCVLHHRVSIEGVSLDKSGKFVLDVMPYQPIETMTVLQTKTNVLSHVEVTTYNGAITGIVWYPDLLDGPVTIRLSNFGSRCADCILWDNLGSKHSVTLIVDDKIEVGENTFRPEVDNVSIIFDGGLGVVFDLRELTNEDTADKIYASIVRYKDGSFETVLDRPDRKQKMREKYYEWAD